MADIILVSQKIQGNGVAEMPEGHVHFYPGNVGYAIFSNQSDGSSLAVYRIVVSYRH